MAHLPERFERLEQQTHTVERQPRRWRSVACGFAILSLLGWGLPLGLARGEASEKARDQKGLEQRVAALEKLLKHFSRDGNEITIKGANLRIVNGLGSTNCGDPADLIPDCPNGLGNLIVGYNELRTESNCGLGPFCANTRTGSHNIVVGQYHNFSSVGGLAVGFRNEISGDFASVSGGLDSRASGSSAAVSGGQGNTASGLAAAVNGGIGHTASGWWSSVSGGTGHTASGDWSSVSGGAGNMAVGESAAVSGGRSNTASGDAAVVSGGEFNTAGGISAVVGGGHNRTADGQFDWVAGSLLEDE
jgi:trimeric autotransporter adhesin